MTRLGKNAHTEYDSLKCADVKCRCVSSPLSTVEKAVIDALEQWLCGYDVTVEAVVEVSENHCANILEELSKELKKIKERREKICVFLEQGVYTAEIFAERNDALRIHENEVRSKIKRLEERAENEQQYADARAIITPNVRKLSDTYYCCKNAEEKNEFLKVVLGRAEYSKTIPNHRGHADNSNITIDIYPTIMARE